MDVCHQHLEIQVLIMKMFVARLVMIMAIAVLGSSCSTLTASTAMKASYDTEEDSWLSRKIPGVKSLSNMIPPPTDARLKWDQYNDKNKKPDTAKSDEF